MYRPMNTIDKVELVNTLTHHGIKDNVADACLIKLDVIMDTIEDLRKQIDNVIEDLSDEGAKDSECFSVKVALSTICQRAINQTREKVFSDL